MVMILIGASIGASAQVQTAQAQFRNALDFDGDGKVDVTVTRFGSTSQPISWFTCNSSNGAMRSAQFGSAYSESNGGTYDYPAAGEYDGKVDIAVHRYTLNNNPAVSYIMRSASGNSMQAIQWGIGTDSVLTLQSGALPSE